MKKVKKTSGTMKYQDLHYIGPKRRRERTRLRNYSKKINENFSKRGKKRVKQVQKVLKFLCKKRKSQEEHAKTC